jgi:hypothetical protein
MTNITRTIAFSVGVLALSHNAGAQPSAQPDSTDTVSENTALALSIAGTAVPTAMMASGPLVNDHVGAGLFLGGMTAALVAPSAGEFYTHHLLTWGMGIRAIGVATTIYGIGVVGSEGLACGLVGASDCHTGWHGEAIFYSGLAITAAGAAYDIVTAPRSARARNRERQASLLLGPTPIATTRGTTGLGFGFVGRF